MDDAQITVSLLAFCRICEQRIYCCLVILLSSIKNMKSQSGNLYSSELTSSKKVLTCLDMVTLKKPTYVVTVTGHSVLFLVFQVQISICAADYRAPKNPFFKNLAFLT